MPPRALALCACVLIAQAVTAVVSSAVIAMEAQVGSTVVLPCPSSDDSHRFQFWQLVDDLVIGPGNAINLDKYKYEVLTGTLHIKGVSTAETGFYKCVSKHISGQGLQIQAVELVVRKDWEEEWESDRSTNTFRGVVAIVVLLGLTVIGGLLYAFYRRQSLIHRLREMSPDEESPDELPGRRTYNSTTVPSTSAQGLDNPTIVVDTDFPTVFKTLNN